MFHVPESVVLKIDIALGSLIYEVLTEYHCNFDLWDVVALGEIEKCPPNLNVPQIIEHLKEQMKKFEVVKIPIHESPVVKKMVETIKNSVEESGFSKDYHYMNKTLFIFKDESSEIQATLNDEMSVMMGCIEKFVQRSKLNLQLMNVSTYRNKLLEKEFFELYSKDDRLVYLLHGGSTNGEHLKYVYSNFEPELFGKGTDPGWYGEGFYLTSYLDYALMYQEKTGNFENIRCKIKDHPFRMMVFLCNPGKIENFNLKNPKTTKEARCNEGKELPKDIDCRFVEVGRQGTTTICFYPKELTPASDFFFDEYVINNRSRVIPQCVLTLGFANNYLIWRDTKMTNGENTKYYQSLKNQFSGVLDLFCVEKNQDVFDILDKVLDKKSVFIVTNRKDQGREFLLECRKRGVQNQCLVFCSYTQNWPALDKVKIDSSSNAIFNFVNEFVLPK